MNLTQKLKSQLAEYETDEFFIDEHARERCRDYHNLDLDDVLQRLKQGKFSKVVKNDSKKDSLTQYESYKARIPKSNQYEYEIVLYLTPDKTPNKDSLKTGPKNTGEDRRCLLNTRHDTTVKATCWS